MRRRERERERERTHMLNTLTPRKEKDSQVIRCKNVNNTSLNAHNEIFMNRRQRNLTYIPSASQTNFQD
jgi:hypothetical protein